MTARMLRKEFFVRIILIVTVLLNLFAPNIITTSAEQNAGFGRDSVHLPAQQDDTPYPVFARPVPKVGEHSSSDSNSLSSPSGLIELRKFDRQDDFQEQQKKIEAEADKFREKMEAIKNGPKPIRNIVQRPMEYWRLLNNQGKDVFSEQTGIDGRIYTVTTLDDHDDGFCDSDCSLREAMYAVNDHLGTDTIIFSVSGTILVETPLPYIDDPAGLTLDGRGQDIKITGKSSSSIQGENDQGDEKQSAGSVKKLALTGISSRSLQSEPILDIPSDFNPDCNFTGEGSVIVTGFQTDCNVYREGSVTLNGHFISGMFISTGSSVTISNSTIEGAYIDALGGNVNISNSTLSDSTSSSQRSLFVYSVNNVIIEGSSINIEDVSHIGNIHAVGFLEITQSTFSNVDNISSSTSATIADSVFTACHFIEIAEQLLIEDSSFEDSYIYGSELSGISNVFLRSEIWGVNTNLYTSDEVEIANSSFWGNANNPPVFSSNDPNFFISGDIPVDGVLPPDVNSAFIGTSVYSNELLTITSGGALTSTNSTFVGTSLDSEDSLLLYNTILAHDTNCLTPASAGSNHNLIEARGQTACGLTNGINNNIIGSNAGFSGYSRNLLNSRYWFFILDSSSPAIDAGDNARCTSSGIDNTSQNGVERPLGDNCDIGSYEAPPITIVNTDETNSSCPLDCGIAASSGTFVTEGSPINTHTGGYDYNVSDISIQTSAGTLAFIRDYSSFGIDQPTTLSPGWTHNHATRLVLPTDPDGEEGTILLKLHSANLFTFHEQQDGSYIPAPGILASLVRQAGPPIQYTLTTNTQEKYTFDENGKLRKYTDAQEQAWTYGYNVDGKLDKINADGGNSYLELTYSQGRIESVSDHTGRSVIYTYGPASGDLTSVKDVLDQIWTYKYEFTSDHFLTHVIAPDQVVIERTTYHPDGRAWQQFDGEGALVVELLYGPNGTTTVRDALGNEETHTYDARGTLTEQTDPAGGVSSKTYLSNFRPFQITDAEDNVTTLNWSGNGTNLTKVIDGLGYQTDIYYNSLNSPTSIVDPVSFETTYTYGDSNYPTLPTRIAYPLSFDNGATWVGTDYTYYPPTSGAAAGKVELETDAFGNQTLYSYTSKGQVEYIDRIWNSELPLTTHFKYDDVGNLTEVTDEQGITTHNTYDDAGRLTKTVRNVHPTDTTQNYLNIYNLTTKYFYDVRGNLIAVIDTQDTITRTYYDLANRPITVVQNLVVSGTENDIDTPRGSIPAYDPEHPDRNIRTDTEYDDHGNVIVSYDPQGVITRTYYDDVNRPELVIQNWSGTDLYGDTSTAPVYVPSIPDQNVRQEYFYDANGNTIATRDTLGIYTRTYFDALNRPRLIVQNWIGNDVVNDPAPDRSACGNVENLCTENFYDANGNLIATIDPKNITTRTYYDSLNRPIAVVQHLTGKSYTDPELPDPSDPSQGECGSENNLCSFTYYDKVGNVIATVDPRGIVTRTYYDIANRPVTIVENLDWQVHDISLTWAPARGNGLSDVNVRTDIAYDSFGRKDIVTDPFNRKTRYEYDAVGQLVKVTVNYVNGGSQQNEADQRNIVTEYEYDALGRQVKTTDTLGRVTRNEYDDLGRVTKTTQNYLEGSAQNFEDAGDRFNIVTKYDYDMRGNQIGVTDTLNMQTRTYYDALGRPISVVRNLIGDIDNPTPPERGTAPDPEENLRTDTVYLGNGSVDYVKDEIGEITDYGYDALGRMTSVLDPMSHPTSYEYDANGNRTLMTDAEGVSTRYDYDGLNRLTGVWENYRPGLASDHETNVHTMYGYDAGGNRLSILDGKGHSTTFTYTAFGQVKTETDALTNRYIYGYDSMGNRRSLIDPNENTILFDYDELNRLKLIDYPEADADVHFTYDALGRRTSMTDDGLNGTTYWNNNNINLPNYIDDPFTARVSYEYDALGNRKKLTYPDSRVVDYTYYDNYLLKEVSSNQAIVAGYDYYATGRLKTITRANDVNTTYHYFDNGWLQDITHTSGTEMLASYQYQYDGIGNRVQAVETLVLPDLNQPPQFELGNDVSINEGGQFTRSIPFTDPDSTQWQLIVDYGDGTTPVQATLNVQGNIDLSHIYAEDGIYTLSVTLTDNENADASDSITVTVANTAPVVNSGSDQTVGVNETVSINATFTDAGILDTHTANIDWGDGNSETGTVTPTGSGSGTVSGTHSYSSAGDYTVEVCVTDSDSGEGCDDLIVYVGDVVEHTLTLQPDANAGNDTFILSNYATMNFGGWTEMGVGEDNGATNGVSRSLIRFDLSAIPSNATITSATLSLWTNIDHANSDNTIRAYRLKKAFSESQATWNRAAFGSTWQTAGASGANDRESTDIGSVLILANEPLNTEKQIALTPAMIQEWIDGTFTNNGLILVANTELNDGFTYKTSDHATASQRPQLVVEYTVPSSPPPTDFPATFVVDNFNRANGAIGSNWQGSDTAFAIASNQMDVVGDGAILWQDGPYGADQEAYVTLVNVDESGGEQDLLLKAQSNSTWGSGVIEVLYNALYHRVEVWTWEWPGGWVKHGTNIPVTFNDGDQFGARALSDCTVEVYKNGELVDTPRDTSAWTYCDQGGFIGLWFLGSTNAVLDDFGGGTISGGESLMSMMSESSTTAESDNVDSGPIGNASGDSFNMELNDVDTFWQGIPLNTEQEAVVTFAQLNATSTRQKPWSNGLWGEAVIQVLYDVPNGRIQVWKYDLDNGWVQQGDDLPVEFADGDQFGAQLGPNGKLTIRQNGKLLGKRDVTESNTVQEETTIHLVSSRLSGRYYPANEVAHSVSVAPQMADAVFADYMLQTQSSSVTITYDYDDLYRLTDANYTNNDYYHYGYDAVGNRVAQESSVGGVLSNTIYGYDDANRMISVNGVTYDWDDNGNLLSDGVNEYDYDSANRLISFSNPTTTIIYRYNGLGDRLEETTNGNTTTFTMDLNTGLTQAFSDGMNTYLYGLGRIAQTTGTDTDYFLTDALGSVRQLTNSSGAITYARAYDPYGVATTTAGNSQTSYGYTNEYTSQGLVYLRARYYSPNIGRFQTKDTWMGDYNRPLSLNRWMYGYDNPVNLTDPSGHFPGCGRATTPGELAACKLYIQYGISIDYTFFDQEKVLIFETVVDFANLLGGVEKFKSNVALLKIRQDWEPHFGLYSGFTKTITLDYQWHTGIVAIRPGHGVELGCQPDLEQLLDVPAGTITGTELQAKFYLAHEIGHAFTNKNPRAFSSFVQNVDLPWAALAGFSKNPLIARNAWRDGFQYEVFADVVAASLYAPILLNNDMQNWIDTVMPGVLQ